MKKKILSMALAAACAFTFSFATVGTASAAGEEYYVKDGTVKWSEDFSSVEADLYKVSDDTKYQTVKADTITVSQDTSADSATYGLVTATADWTVADERSVDVTAKYYDITDAKAISSDSIDVETYLESLHKPVAADTAITGKTVYALESDFAIASVALKVVDTTKSATVPIITVPVAKIENVCKAMEIQPNSDYAAYEESESFTLKTVNNKACADVVGTPADFVTKLAIKSSTFNNVKFEISDVESEDSLHYGLLENGKAFSIAYDGCQHTAAVTSKGIKAEYKVTERDGVAVTSPAYTTEAPVLQAASTSDGPVLKMDVKVSSAAAGSSASREFTGITLNVTAQEATIKFSQSSFSFNAGRDISVLDLVKTKGFADEDQDAVNAFIEKYLVIEGLFEKPGSNEIVLSQVDDIGKKMTDEERTLMDNYLVRGDWSAGTAGRRIQNIDIPYDSAYLTLSKAENDITAPATTLTYHVKKAKKISKTKYYQLNDSADYGEIVYTKMSGSSYVKVSKAGKVTVKKGLKKGTYTVKVKAKVAGTEAYCGAKCTKTLKVRIVK